jgi:hypothetical protein
MLTAKDENWSVTNPSDNLSAHLVKQGDNATDHRVSSHPSTNQLWQNQRQSAGQRLKSMESVQRFIEVDKIASVAHRCQLSNQVSILMVGQTPRAGDLIVCKVLTDQSNYDRLELTNGRMARLNKGDIIVGAFGARRALKGYVGEIPQEIALGDELHILNLGGVIGHCTGYHRDMSPPLKVEFLGYVFDGDKVSNMGDFALGENLSWTMASTVPVIAVAGSCMHSGKTRAASELVRRFSDRGYKVATGKLSGVGCLKDSLEMRDHGATKSLCFIDLGLPSTVGVKDLGMLARSIIGHLATPEVDLIIAELGDGILGSYHVGSILDDDLVKNQLAGLVYCAGDFVGTWGGIELLKQKNMSPDVISGSVTDSKMGCDFIRSQFSIPAANAMVQGQTLFSIMESKMLAWRQRCQLV